MRIMLQNAVTQASRAGAHARQIWDISSDGCTGVPDLNIRHCCEQHDYCYRNATVSRAEADRRLRLCIADKGWPVLPWVYWAGVRLLGWRHYRYDRRV